MKVIVLTGTAFAAGADIKAMAEASPIELMLRRNHEHWQAIALPEADHRCGQWLCAGRWLRGRHARRHHCRRRERNLRPAGSAGGHHARRWRHAAPDPRSAQEVLEAALEIARTITNMPPLAIQQIKEVMLAGQDAPLETALMLERKAFQMLFDSADQKEGMRGEAQADLSRIMT